MNYAVLTLSDQEEEVRKRLLEAETNLFEATLELEVGGSPSVSSPLRPPPVPASPFPSELGVAPDLPGLLAEAPDPLDPLRGRIERWRQIVETLQGVMSTLNSGKMIQPPPPLEEK